MAPLKPLKAVFLDRDDTVIKNIPYMNKVEDISYLPYVFGALKNFQDVGYVFFIVTNQSGLSRGLITYSELEQIHKKIRNDFIKQGLRIFKFCISPYKHKHPRRKPGYELLLEAQKEYNIDLAQSIMIGDGLRDVEAGQQANVKLTFQVKDLDRFWFQFLSIKRVAAL